MLVTLPNGLLDGVDLFNVAEIDELRGKQQNYLHDKELVVGNIGHVPKILEDMLLSLQTPEGLKWQGKLSEAIWKLPSGDLETLLVKIRENTYGPKFYHEGVCTHCEHENKNLLLMLDSLEIGSFSIQERMAKKVIKLPKSELEVELKPVYLKDLFDVIKISKGKQNSLITSFLSVSIKRLGDKQNIVSTDIENIPSRDIVYLQEQMKDIKLEAHIDTDIEITCSNKECGKDFKIKLNCFEPSFFDHTKGSHS